MLFIPLVKNIIGETVCLHFPDWTLPRLTLPRGQIPDRQFPDG